MCRYHIYVAAFLKTNLAKFADLSEKASEGRLFGPEKLQNRTNQGKAKERRKRKTPRTKEEERRRREKTMVALLVFIMASLKIVFGHGRKKLLDAKSLYNYLAVTFSKIRLDIAYEEQVS